MNKKKKECIDNRVIKAYISIFLKSLFRTFIQVINKEMFYRNKDFSFPHAHFLTKPQIKLTLNVNKTFQALVILTPSPNCLNER